MVQRIELPPPGDSRREVAEANTYHYRI